MAGAVADGSENVQELVRVRWGVTAVYLAAALFAQLEALHVSTTPLLLAALLTGLSNLPLSRRRRARTPRRTMLSLLLIDWALLSGVLAGTGGASNPLSAMYIVPIALSGLLLGGPWAYVLGALSVFAFGLLFLAPQVDDPAGAGMHAHHHHDAGGEDPFGAHLRGMWLAFALTSALIAYFVTRLTDQLRRARAKAVRAERVASLASVAASTSHELGTPLGSILLAATEMAQTLPERTDPPELREDVALIASQARRCRTILDAMQARAGEMVGESPTLVDPTVLLDEAVAGLPTSVRTRIELRRTDGLPPLRLPARVVTQALQNLLQNALDASPEGAAVEAGAELSTGKRVCFWVRDHGPGLDAAAAEAAMEPFVSSKESPGHGLGLFLARSLAEQLDGSLTLGPAPGGGLLARFEVTSTQ